MDHFDVWDGLLLAVVGYVAVTSLVRLMAMHRRETAGRILQQQQAERLRERRAAKLASEAKKPAA